MNWKKVVTFMVVSLLWLPIVGAQQEPGRAADDIVGTYEGVQEGYKFRAKIVKLDDGSFRGQVVWMERDKDEKGNKLLDTKNPDKSLRGKPADRVVLFSGLRYDAKRQEWSGCKIYDPLRGLRAKLTATFAADGRLRLKGSLMGFSESVYWKKIG